MEFTTVKTSETRTNFNQYNFNEQNKLTIERLNSLLAINAETERRKLEFSSDREKTEAAMMGNRLGLKQTFSYFGLMLGIFPPAAFFLQTFILGSPARPEYGIYIFCFLINILTAVVGFYSGRLIAGMVKKAETFPWWAMIFLSPLIGIVWGVMAGGAGGAIALIIGGVFGAIIGAMVGGAAMPLFLILHRWLKRGEFMETKHFLPIAFGITLTICSFILRIT